MKAIVIAVKPKFANLLIQGVKTLELRKGDWGRLQEAEAFVYATSPVKKIVGGFRVENVWINDPESELTFDDWGKSACVTEREFKAYYKGCELASALEVAEPWAFDKPRALCESIAGCEEETPTPTVPQSWRYADEREVAVFYGLRESEMARGILESASEFQESTPQKEGDLLSAAEDYGRFRARVEFLSVNLNSDAEYD